MVARLDAVVQAYADVMRKAPSLTDAAYNYEFVREPARPDAKGPQKSAARRQEARRRAA